MLNLQRRVMLHACSNIMHDDADALHDFSSLPDSLQNQESNASSPKKCNRIVTRSLDPAGLVNRLF